VAIVAENKDLNSRIVECYPMEEFPLVDGEITPNVMNYESEGTTFEGESHNDKTETTITVKATWLPIACPNRFTSPDVRRGERVVLYRFADNDEFWWCTLREDHQLRKLETVIWGFSGTRKEEDTPNESNTYFFEVSTHKKIIRLHTTKADKEPFGYDIEINTGKGYIQIMDDDGNMIKFDSSERQIVMLNKDESYFDMNKEDLTIKTKSTIHIETKDLTIVNETQKITSDTSIFDIQTHTSNINSFTSNTSTYTQNGTINVNGDIINVGQLITGGMSITGTGGTGNATISGNATITGNVEASGTFTAPGGYWHGH
jgi:hypothetical protein